MLDITLESWRDRGLVCDAAAKQTGPDRRKRSASAGVGQGRSEWGWDPRVDI